MFGRRATAALLALAAAHVWAERVSFEDCYAEWGEGRLTVGNARFERVWVAAEGGLAPVSFVMKAPEVEWLAGGPGPKAAGALVVRAAAGRRSAVGAQGLRVAVAARDGREGGPVFWVFPGASGTLAEGVAEPGRAGAAEGAAAASGIESEPQAKLAEAAAGQSGAETLRLGPQHLRVTQVSLMDQTDTHNELVWEREWLLMPNEAAFDLQGCVLAVENALDGSGLVFLKLAPLPHARPDRAAADFRVNAGSRAVTAWSGGYPVASLAYRGGRVGRTRALHALQRCLRAYRPERDGQFLSNTWGDRSRDARINEAFLLREVEAGAALGVDVVQIDDGWQKGRSANSVAARGKGAWNGYWAADPHFWEADPARFPNGLERVVRAARDQGMGFGLWFGPDSSGSATNWQRDAQHLLKLHRELGVDYFKIDSMKTHDAVSLRRQRAMFDSMLEGSGGAMTFDLDVTAEVRPGYFGLPDIGPLFVENRYTDFHRYWPHQTLRNLWMLSQVVDPVRLRVEVLNNARNADKYKDDPLAPARYRPDTLLAIALPASPLGWFEVSNLPDSYVAQMRPLVRAWKAERARLHGGVTVPVGAAPDGVAWTGFVTAAADGAGGYALLFRGLNPAADFALDVGALLSPVSRCTVCGGRGTARVAGGRLTVNVPEALDFVWVRLD